MGIALQDRERLRDLHLKASQGMERARFGPSEHLLFERVQVFVEIYDPTVRALDVLFANRGATVEDARDPSGRGGAGMLTIMAAVRSIIVDGSWSYLRV